MARNRRNKRRLRAAEESDRLQLELLNGKADEKWPLRMTGWSKWTDVDVEHLAPKSELSPEQQKGLAVVLIALLVTWIASRSGGQETAMLALIGTPTTRAGKWLLMISETICGKQRSDRIFGQIVADMREEIHDADRRGKRLEAAMARIRGYAAFGKASGLVTALKLIGKTYLFLRGG